MPQDLALVDLISPYVLLGQNIDAWHAALTVIYVHDYEVAVDSSGTVIRGTARFSGDASVAIDPRRLSIVVTAANQDGHPQNDPGRRDPWFDINDARIEFQLFAPRQASQIIAAGVAAIGGGGFAPTQAVLTAYDSDPTDAPPSDYPSTEFTLDLLLTSVILRPPFLRGAKMQPDGLLVADPDRREVKFTMPRIKARLAQGSQVGNPITFSLLNVGASGLDDSSDIAVAELISMDPPYAFIGDSSVVGFGFRSATLDLSDRSTPPDVLAQFGYDESWTGLYLPEIRIFLAPPGALDLAFDAGARNLLIGIGQTPGITGDFELMVMDAGSTPLRLGARFFDADGRSYGISNSSPTTATASLPNVTRMVVDIGGGRAPYVANAAIGGAPPKPGRVFDVDLSTDTEKTIVITVTDARAGQPPTTLTVVAKRRPAPALPAAGSGAGAGSTEIGKANFGPITITQDGAPATSPSFKIVSQIGNSVSVSLDPPNAATQWTIGGVAKGTSGSVTFEVAPGATVSVKGEVAGASTTGPVVCYYRFDHPKPTLTTDSAIGAFALQAGNTSSTMAIDDGASADWIGGNQSVMGTYKPALDKIPPGATLTITGFASVESDTSQQTYDYNRLLAQRRYKGLRSIIENQYGAGHFNIVFAPDQTKLEWQGHTAPRNRWWKAEASFPAVTRPGTVTTGNITREKKDVPPPPPPKIPVTDEPAPAVPPPPKWFKSAALKVRIVHDQFVALELSGKIDFETATEDRLRTHGIGDSQMPDMQGLGSQNPADGIVDFRLLIQIDDASQQTTVSLSLGADPADRDGLIYTGALQNAPLKPASTGRNALGVICLFTPLIAEVAPPSPAEATLQDIVLTGAVIGVPFALAELGLLTVERVILYGGELVVRAGKNGWQSTLLFDVETAVSADIKLGSFSLLKISRKFPLTVRYKAIGIKLAGEPRFELRPMFDASKGYTIDVSKPGAIEVAPPLGQIMQVLGARIAKNNPTILEVELGFAIDLGVVSLDRLRVRMKLDAPGFPELTGIGAGVDIPGALKGHGYLELSPSEIKGQIDITIIPVSVRIAAGLGIANIAPADGGPATGVIITLQVEFPVAIPLGSSGLGIFGFLGLFAMNYARNEADFAGGNMAPALAWLKATGGDPTNIAFWKPKVNTWAFGVGALLGTMEGGVIFNLKGVFLLELPGPRLLLMMKAKLLQPMPELKTSAEGNLLAVIDLDAGRGTLTIGIVADYTVDPLLSIRIPVEAFFNFKNGKDWHLYLGKFDDQIHANILQVFQGSGYVMLSGNGIPAHGKLPAVFGFAIAAGLHVAFTWGSTAIGLYAQIAAGFDATVGFDPFRIAGILYVRGELHLFIISIGAYAELRVDAGTKEDGTKVSRIDGDICGKIDFFFFSIEGCVHFHIGDNSVPGPPPPKLVNALKLISRSPALVLGTATDKPVDGGIGDGVEGSAEPGGLPVVPIDAIPVMMMSASPLDAGLTIFGAVPGGSPGAPADGFVQRGEVWFKYELQSVELVGGVSAGNTPSVWWTLAPSTDPNYSAQLALLSWVPTATPKAIERSEFLEETIKDRWGTVCDGAAPPAPVLWTFRFELLGPSVTGWDLDGEAWPDPPKGKRSTPVDLLVTVTERWRCGNPYIDQLRGVIPAEVQGAQVECPSNQHDPAVPPGIALPPFVPTRFNVNPVGLGSIVGRKMVEPVNSEELTFAEALTRVESGAAVPRSTIARLVASPDLKAVGAANLPCTSRVLAAPILDEKGRLIVFGDPANEEKVKLEWEKRNFNPGKFEDAIVVRTAEFAYTRLLLFVRRDLIQQKRVVVAAMNEKENILRQHIIDATDVIPPAALPGAWSDAGGPWRDDIELVLRHFFAIRPRETYSLVFVEIKGKADADRVQIGVLPSDAQEPRKVILRPFFVAAIECLRMAELLRSDYDKTTIDRERKVLESAFSLESADYALLLPNTVYRINATWKATSAKRNSAQVLTDVTPGAPVPQSFWFRTDDKPPARLDPWLLTSVPGDGETHFFGSEEVKIVFATNDVARIYDTYGKKLQARYRASSSRHPESKPGAKHPYAIDPTTLTNIKASVLSPWEAAAQDILTGSCIPINGERVRHTSVTIPIPLEPFTDYVLDIEMLNKSDGDSATGPVVLRRSFSTGGFATLAKFAEAFLASRVEHRYAQPAKLQAVGVKFVARAPEGAEFDSALIDAGLEPMQVPSFPRTVVFWEQPVPALPPQPAAILIDASEPMWRSRLQPTLVADPAPSTSKRWELKPKPWLRLDQQAGGDPIVDHIVVAPGAQRALVTLKPGSRGKQVRLALIRIAQKLEFLDGTGATDQFVTVLDMKLTQAPWEES